MKWHVPGFNDYKYDTRHGDCQFFEDESRFLVIDGYCGSAPAGRLISDLKLFKAHKEGMEVRAAISHWHYDHYDGIRRMINHKTNGKRTFNVTTLYCQDPDSLEDGLRDNAGSKAVKSDIARAREIIAEAKAAGVKVVYLHNEQRVEWGDIKFDVYRIQPSVVKDDDTKGWSYMNDGSLAFYFYELRYLTSGDGPEKLGDLCMEYGLNPLFIKGVHHGNNLPRVQATIMWNLGCRYYWDNDRSKGITDFLQTGREDAIAVGMKVLDVVGDINGYTYKGYFCVFHKGKLQFKYKCDAPAQKFVSVTALLVRKIIRGTYSSGDKRISKVLAAGFNPAQAQTKVNKVIKIAKGIKDGSLNYGKNEERRKKIDAELGAGFGKLVQDYINVLYGVRKQV